MGMGMCGPEDPLFTPLLLFARVPFQKLFKSQFTRSPFEKKLEIQFTRPLFQSQNSLPKPVHFKNLGRTPLPPQKLSASPLGAPPPPPPGVSALRKLMKSEFQFEEESVLFCLFLFLLFCFVCLFVCFFASLFLFLF